MTINVTRATTEQADDLGFVLTRAFVEDPGCCHIFPERDRRIRQMQRLFACSVRLMVNNGQVFTTPEQAGCALWLPSEALKNIGVREFMRAGFLSAAHKLSIKEKRRGLEVHLDAMKRIQRHIKEPHWILDTLGVAPEHQGRGVAAALIRAGCKEADAAKIPCFVITHKFANISFYQKAGFHLLEMSQIRGLNIVVASLRRGARSAAAAKTQSASA